MVRIEIHDLYHGDVTRSDIRYLASFGVRENYGVFPEGFIHGSQGPRRTDNPFAEQIRNERITKLPNTAREAAADHRDKKISNFDCCLVPNIRHSRNESGMKSLERFFGKISLCFGKSL